MKLILNDERISKEVNLSKKGIHCFFDKEDENKFRTLKVSVLLKLKHNSVPEPKVLRLLIDQENSLLDLIFKIVDMPYETYDTFLISFNGKDWLRYSKNKSK